MLFIRRKENSQRPMYVNFIFNYFINTAKVAIAQFRWVHIQLPELIHSFSGQIVDFKS